MNLQMYIVVILVEYVTIILVFFFFELSLLQTQVLIFNSVVESVLSLYLGVMKNVS